MIVLSAGNYRVATAGARAFAILNTNTKAMRVARGEDAAALAADLINRSRPESVAESYLAAYFQ